MAKSIYVGNLPWSVDEENLRAAFAPYGEVISAKVMTDRETGRSRGFGFVEMESGYEEAIRALDGSMMGGRNLKVNEAQPRQPRPAGDRPRRW